MEADLRQRKGSFRYLYLREGGERREAFERGTYLELLISEHCGDIFCVCDGHVCSRSIRDREISWKTKTKTKKKKKKMHVMIYLYVFLAM